MGNIEEMIKGMNESKERLRCALEKMNEIEANTILADKIIRLINYLSKNGDERIRRIGEAYISILKTEKNISRVPWRVLDYLESNHLDLYRKIQMMTPISRT